MERLAAGYVAAINGAKMGDHLVAAPCQECE